MPTLTEVQNELRQIVGGFKKDKDSVTPKLTKLFKEVLESEDEPVKLWVLNFLNKEHPEIMEYVSASLSELNITEIEFSGLPAKVDIEDIHDNGKLLSDEGIEKVKQYFKNNPDVTRASKHEVGVKYTIVYSHGSYYAVYPKSLGAGAFGSVKLRQNLITGEWSTQKSIETEHDAQQEEKNTAEVTKEAESLRRVGQGGGEIFSREVWRELEKETSLEDQSLYKLPLMLMKEIPAVDTLSLKGKEPPLLIKVETNDQPLFYVYGLSESGKAHLTELKMNVEKLKTIDFNKENAHIKPRVVDVVREGGKRKGEIIYDYREIYGEITAKKAHVPEAPKIEQRYVQRVLGMALASGQSGRKLFGKDADIQLSDVEWLQIGLSFLTAYKEQVSDNGFIHRDIKLDNAHYDKVTGKWTFIDWGMAITQKEAEKRERGPGGSAFYQAPEISNGCDVRFMEEFPESGQGHEFSYIAVGNTLRYVNAEGKYEEVDNFNVNFMNELKAKNISYIRLAPQEVYKLNSNHPDKKMNPFYSVKTDEYAAIISLAQIFGLAIEGEELSGSPMYRIKNVDEAGKNLRINNPETRKAIINYLHGMTDVDPSRRDSLEEFMECLQKAIDLSPDYASKIRRVALFDVSEYQHADDKGKAKLRAALKGADEVWLVDVSDKKNQIKNQPKKLYELQRELEKEDISVGRSLFSKPGANIEEAVYGVVRKAQGGQTDKFRSFHFVTTEETRLDFTRVNVIHADTQDDKKIAERYQYNKAFVSENTRGWVKANLEKELMRIKENYGVSSEVYKEREKLINDFMPKLKEPNLTFQALEKGLKDLEENIYSGNGFKRFMEKILDVNVSYTARLVKGIREEASKPKLGH